MEPVDCIPEDWEEYFLIFPRKTVVHKWIWGKCYRRKVWVSYGIGLEPEYEYGNLFDVLTGCGEQLIRYY